MSTHKAMATRCLSYHEAASGQHAIWALATAPLRRLALSVLFTIMTTSYQTTLYSLREIFNKRQHTNARHRVEFSHYDSSFRFSQHVRSVKLWGEDASTSHTNAQFRVSSDDMLKSSLGYTHCFQIRRKG